MPLIPRLLWLTPIENPGIAFGLFAGLPRLAAILIALTVLFLLFYNVTRPSAAPTATRSRSPLSRGEGGRRGAVMAVAVGLIAGGAIGNLIDRIRLGYVFDYLDLRWWPVFNLADAAVVVGAAIFLLSLVHAADASAAR